MKIDSTTFQEFKSFNCIDAHTEGEPLRIITSGYPKVIGVTMLDKRRYLQDNFDQYRRILMHEPRGHGVIATCKVAIEDGQLTVWFNNLLDPSDIFQQGFILR